MMRLAPAAGLVMASPVVIGALRGQRDVDEALVAWLLAMVVSVAGLWLLRQVLVVTDTPDGDGAGGTQGEGGRDEDSRKDTGEPREGRQGDTAAASGSSPPSPARRRGDD